MKTRFERLFAASVCLLTSVAVVAVADRWMWVVPAQSA